MSESGNLVSEPRLAGFGLGSSLGIGTMHWGDTPLDRKIAGKILPNDEIAAIAARARAAGVVLLDTAEGYGGGSSERRIGRLGLARSGHEIATKFLPTYWRWTENAVVRAQRASNRRLAVDVCDVGFIHSPVHPRSPDVWVRGFARAYRLGLVKALGVSNFNAEQVRRAARIASDEGLPLVANQIQFNLLVAASAALKETVAASREHGLTVWGYGILGQGLLTDGLTRPRFDGSVLARRLGLSWESLQPVRSALFRVAERHRRSLSHVCLAWVRAHGVLPLVGTRSVAQLEDSLGGLDFSISDDEKNELDACALGFSTFDRPLGQRFFILGFLSLLMTAYRVSSCFSRG